MGRFKYKALAPDGRYTEGVMGAADREGVIARLRASNHMPVMVTPEAADEAPEENLETKGRRAGIRRRRRRPSRASVAIFTRELQTLLEAGLPADRALEAIVEASAAQPIADVAADLRARFTFGLPFT